MEHESMEGEILAPNAGALEQISRAEVDIQISTAHRYPRDVRKAESKVRQIALASDEAAAQCHYALPRKDKDGKTKTIIGPSIRLAEIVASSWGNMRVATRVMDIGEKDLTVMAIAHDLESNVAITSEVKRRITTSKGYRYSDDMVVVTANAAGSIAFRNVVFRVVPQPIWKPVYEEAINRQRAGPPPAPGKPELSIEARWTKAVEAFKEFGVTGEKILFRLGHKTAAEVIPDDFVALRGFLTAIKEETSTAEEIFGDDSPSRPTKTLNLGPKPPPGPLSPPQREPGEEP